MLCFQQGLAHRSSQSLFVKWISEFNPSQGVVFRPGYIFKSPGRLIRPYSQRLMQLVWGGAAWQASELFKNSPGDSHVQPRLRTISLEWGPGFCRVLKAPQVIFIGSQGWELPPTHPAASLWVLKMGRHYFLKIILPTSRGVFTHALQCTLWGTFYKKQCGLLSLISNL